MIRSRMRIVQDPELVRRAVRRWKRAGERVAFVPTMGAIHDGHLSLVDRAGRSADRIVTSIFVNPLQFGPKEDFARYPRPRARDHRLLKKAGVHLIWEPGAADLYPAGESTRVRVAGLSDVLDGASRPGHFEGVSTVVIKLLNIVEPDLLWLGQKDAQQARIIERMVSDLHLPIRVRRGATVREPDGLALSSRNRYLKRKQRADAIGLYRGLQEVRRRLRAGERSSARLRAAMRRVWRQYPLVREDYIAIVDANTLQPIRKISGRVLVAVAAYVGSARLIDNFEWEPR